MRLERFVVVGALCALLSNAALVVLVRLGLGSVAACALVFGPVLLIGYALHSILTFGTQLSRLTFARYALATVANFPISVGALYVLCDVFRISVEIAAPLTTALMFLWSYASARWAWSIEWRVLWWR